MPDSPKNEMPVPNDARPIPEQPSLPSLPATEPVGEITNPVIERLRLVLLETIGDEAELT